MKTREFLVLFAAASLAIGSLSRPLSAQPLGPAKFMMSLKLNDEFIEGSPIAWNDSRIDFLTRDGRWIDFHPDVAIDYQKTSDKFRAMNRSQMRSKLQSEFGSDFRIFDDGHYITVRHIDLDKRWDSAFEDLYRSYFRFFRARGFKLEEPFFPLVAIVLPNRTSFVHYAAKDSIPVANGMVGYYFQKSNRVVLYQQPGRSWEQNYATVVHEATHQMAFNTGIHQRYFVHPQWIIEGLATVFETPGIWDSSQSHSLKKRVNPVRLRDFKRFLARKPKAGFLEELVLNDDLFKTRPLDAYGLSWAYTFYLMERYPKKYVALLKTTSQHEALQELSQNERLEDYTKQIGHHWQQQEADFLRWFHETFPENS